MDSSGYALSEEVTKALARLPVNKLVALLEVAARREPLFRNLAIVAAAGAEDLVLCDSAAAEPTTSFEASLQSVILPGYATSLNKQNGDLSRFEQVSNVQEVPRTPTMAACGLPSSISTATTTSNDNMGEFKPQQQQQMNAAAAAMSSSLLTTSPLLRMQLLGATPGPQQQQQVQQYSSDEFRMFLHKAVPCTILHNHNWNACPYSHPGENACRRDPRRFKYVAVSCPYNKAGACMLGESCPYAHGVFEVNLHPGRYRTEACRNGGACTRAVCFFAHCTDEIRQPLLDWCPTPEEFAAVEGVRAQRVKATLPQNHPLQGMIDSAMSDALSQLNLQGSGGSGMGTSGA